MSTSTDPLLDELLAKRVGPSTPEPTAWQMSAIASQIERNGDSLSLTINADEGTVTEGTGLTYLAEEGLVPEDWEIIGFRKVKYGSVDAPMESVGFTYRKVRVALLDEHKLSEACVDAWRKSLLEWQPLNPDGYFIADIAGTYVMLIADPQFGKKRTSEAIANYKRGVLGHVAAARALSDEIEQIHVGWMGDETENVVNSYGNQPHTIELNRTQQLELDYDMRVWTLKQVLALNKAVTASSVISNHGEWTRNGGKEPVTTQGDNASTYVARQVKSLFDELEPFTGQHVEWFIGGGDPGVSITLSGVPCYFSHGYIEKGKGASVELRTKSAIERQILGKTDELGKTLLWFMAHYHHWYSQEFEGRTVFGCPALEAERSSEYMLNQFGVWSPPGMLGMLVGHRYSRGWSHLNVF